MTTIRPGWTGTHGVGPDMNAVWDLYWDNVPKGAVGIDSFGRIVRADGPVPEAEDRVYRPMIDRWWVISPQSDEFEIFADR